MQKSDDMDIQQEQSDIAEEKYKTKKGCLIVGK